MINKISLQLVNESHDTIPVAAENANVESLLEIAMAEMFSEICTRNNNLDDKEIRVDEKFRFCLNLREYLIDLEVF